MASIQTSLEDYRLFERETDFCFYECSIDFCSYEYNIDFCSYTWLLKNDSPPTDESIQT